MKDRWFGITLSDCHFKVKETDLYNKNKYKVKILIILKMCEDQDKMNRKMKQQSKRTEMELTNIQKEAVKKAHLRMLEDYKINICEAVEKGVFGRIMLDKWVQSTMTPFVHKNSSFKAFFDRKKCCVSISLPLGSQHCA